MSRNINTFVWLHSLFGENIIIGKKPESIDFGKTVLILQCLITVMKSQIIIMHNHMGSCQNTMKVSTVLSDIHKLPIYVKDF